MALVTPSAIVSTLQVVASSLALAIHKKQLTVKEEVFTRIFAATVVTVHWLACGWQVLQNSATTYAQALYWSLVAVSTTGE